MDLGNRRFPAPWLIVVLLSQPLSAGSADGGEFFEKKIRPLLAEHCYACHSSASQPVMGGLILDQEEGFRSGGSRGSPVVAGDPESSLLIRAVTHQDEKLRMPLAGRLPDEEIALLADWVRMGAPWGMAPNADQKASETEGFWAFEPPVEPSLPQVRDVKWVRSPIDRYILARLEAEGLTPAPVADRRTLIRRATFDLTGLPPTIEEIRDFLQDRSPGAYSRLIERLLSSPRYGERWGRHWLDVARYADSNGLDENMAYTTAFRYRDYVVQALNRDKPYDQFVREQLAGDLLPDTGDLETTLERWTATGFLSLGPKMLAEDDPVKMRMDIIDEQLDTSFRAFLGLTVGCARCHDHKFDPVSIRDYYSLAGIFRSSKTMEHHDVVAEWHEHVLAPADDRLRLQQQREKIEAKTKAIEAVTKRENKKLVEEGRTRVGAYLLAAQELAGYQKIRLKSVFEGRNPDPESLTVREAGNWDRGNVERQLKKGKTNIPKTESSDAPPDTYFAEYDVEIPAAGPYQLEFLEAETGAGTADIHINGTLVKRGIEAIENRTASPDAGGWMVAGIFDLKAGSNTLRLEHKTRFPYFEKLLLTANPLPEEAPIPRTLVQVAHRDKLNPVFLYQWIDRLRRSRGAPYSVLYAWHAQAEGRSREGWQSPAAKLFENVEAADLTDLASHYQKQFRLAEEAWRALVREQEVVTKKFSTVRTDEETEETKLEDPALEAMRAILYEKWGPFRPPEKTTEYFPDAALRELDALEAERKKLEEGKPDLPSAMGITEGQQIDDLAIHLRGSHWDLGEKVPRGFPGLGRKSLEQLRDPASSGRLELANWITRDDNPLAARVMVNRIWRWHMGRGLVASTDNFGRLGDAPTHPDLLNWLAIRFVEGNWSLKQMHRLIMHSATYRMSTGYSAQGSGKDPENRLLWRMNRRQLEAEAIRDSILAVSANLDLKPGGSLLGQSGRGYIRPGTRYDWNRRSIYLPVVRSSMYDFLRAFDFADPSVTDGDRGASVVAPQALFLMNDSLVLENSRRMATGLLAREDLDETGRVRVAYESALGRLPNQEESRRALEFVARMDAGWRDRVEEPGERRLRSWQGFCQALMASSEFAYLN
ncbi:MAG: DUF1549 domain-containing protein [Candidatus Aminicenantes bacterium]|nr:DUF1549 domain-containing protein [Candidatus Aminicenantes bacterium]